MALDVFGSAANGHFDPSRSHYDFIARFSTDEGHSLARRYVAFSEALESLLGRPVDVMADHPIDNPYLRAAVAASRRAVYGLRLAVALRNRIVHGYDRVEHAIVVDTVKRDLPEMADRLKVELSQYPVG